MSVTASVLSVKKMLSCCIVVEKGWQDTETVRYMFSV